MSSLIRDAVSDALARFGPSEDFPPTVVDSLVLLVAEFIGSTAYERFPLQRLADDLVIAYGVGWHRVLDQGSGWPSIWPLALAEVERRVRQALLRSDSWLLTLPVFGLAEVLSGRAPSSLSQSDRKLSQSTPGCDLIDSLSLRASEITNWLINGSCICYRRRVCDPDQPLDPAARTMRERCLHQHPLTGWDPTIATLQNRILNAVKGPIRAEGQLFGGNQFYQGLYSTWLYLNCGVRLGSVAGWLCPCCGKERDGALCRKCGVVFDPAAHKVISLEARLYLATHHYGAYEAAGFYKCKAEGCGNLYPDTTSACPLSHCRTPRKTFSSRALTLQILTGFAKVSISSPLSANLEDVSNHDDIKPPLFWDESCEIWCRSNPLDKDKVEALSNGLYGPAGDQRSIGGIAHAHQWCESELEDLNILLLWRAWKLHWQSIRPAEPEVKSFRSELDSRHSKHAPCPDFPHIFDELQFFLTSLQSFVPNAFRSSRTTAEYILQDFVSWVHRHRAG
ncbi:MAG: hypothetical protein JNN07_13790 [Verrucomicrobiales bacterium]|nr:hypothetical protein [Verrucomicrobiales bacterium]